MRFRYRAQRRQLVIPALVTTGIFLAPAAPQFPAMIAVHIPYGASQRSSVLSSSLHLLQSIAASEAYLPWHPLAIAADLLFAALCICGLVAPVRIHPLQTAIARRPQFTTQSDSALASILIFGLLFFLLVAGTGLGSKPRNGLLIIPLLAPAAALITASLRPRVQTAILIFIALWSAVGIAHLTGRYGLAKASMISRPEQVTAFIRQTSGSDCSVVVTHDVMLAFTLNQAHILPHTIVVSPFREPLLGGPRYLPGNDCPRIHLYVVQSYAGEQDNTAQELQSATHFFNEPPRADSFSFDPDAARKRSLARVPGLGGDLAAAAALPDYRYNVISGPTDLSHVSAMRQSLPGYISGQTISSKNSPLTP